MIGENNMDAAEKVILSTMDSRMAVMEEKQKNSEKDRSEIKERIKEVKEDVSGVSENIDALRKDIAEQREEFAKLKGTWGGIILAITSIGTFLAFAWDYIMKFLKNGFS